MGQKHNCSQQVVKADEYFTLNEITSQPDLWEKIFIQILEDKIRIRDYLQKVQPEVKKIILTGAGSSAFIGISLHGSFCRWLNIHTDAVPTTDLVSHPGDYFFKNEKIILVSFSRSGNSPESCAAINLADKFCGKCFHIIITCDPEGKVAKYQTKTESLVIILPSEANDKGLAMTGSYSGMLLTGLLLARINNIEELSGQIHHLSKYGKRIIKVYGSKLKGIARLNFERAIFLGSGPFYGTATESHLKLQELTDGTIICKKDSYLGFRHGPKAVTNENTIMIFIFSNIDYVNQYERDLIHSMQNGKKPMLTIGISEKKLPGLKFDVEIVFSGSGKIIDEELLPVCSVIPAQLLGFYKSIDLGLDPDDPSVSRAISRVVENVTIYNCRTPA